MKFKVVGGNKIIVGGSVKVTRNKIYQNYIGLGWQEVYPVYQEDLNLYEVTSNTRIKGLQNYVICTESIEEATQVAKRNLTDIYGEDDDYVNEIELKVEFFSKHYTLETK